MWPIGESRSKRCIECPFTMFRGVNLRVQHVKQASHTFVFPGRELPRHAFRSAYVRSPMIAISTCLLHVFEPFLVYRHFAREKVCLKCGTCVVFDLLYCVVKNKLYIHGKLGMSNCACVRALKKVQSGKEP